ncbi:Cyclic nucleotide-gated ion channel 1 [Abeliophyllum distichum]|uniref:Cyclic nucleotide-gated ion channel 1 n=1 Tax=Abeliophyllum distichum TaxID=126358 RepID=A0ABD1TH52_9LAMI
MSLSIYENWGRLVEAVIRREQLWQMFHDRSPSVSSISSDFSLDSQVLDVCIDFPAVENSEKKEKTVKKGSSGLVLEMRVKRRDAMQWMSYGLLPESLRERIMSYNKYLMVRNLPKDLSKDIMRHICLAHLKRVPMFEKVNEQLLDAVCDRLESVVYAKGSFTVREGDPLDAMLFIMRGKLLSVTSNGGRSTDSYLRGGEFCGEELFIWAFDRHSSSDLPISTRTVQALSKVQVFALVADDLKFLASQFRRLHGKQMRNNFRLYSQQWRNWAARVIQVAWGHKYNYGKNKSVEAIMLERIWPIMLQKPAEPDFTAEDNVAYGNPYLTTYINDYDRAACIIQVAWRHYYRKKLITREEANMLRDALPNATNSPILL